MCSIMGLSTKAVGRQELLGYLDRSVSRGPDSSRLMETGRGWLGFHRLAIMGLDERGMQPFCLRGKAAVCNGEIYGFRAMREDLKQAGYTFAGESDCELILPLYERYGLDMFAMLDAEFALIIDDPAMDGLIAARDPIGIRPLYYGRLKADGSMAFASVPKNLMGLVEHIHPFPPGHYWARGEFVRFADLTSPQAFHREDVDTVCHTIRHMLISAVHKRLDADAPLGFLLSGGLDSSLVCAIAARESDRPIRTFSIGMEKDAIDLKYARQVADYIGSEHSELIVKREDILSVLPRVIEELATFDITTIRASIGMYLLCRFIRETSPVRVLLTGEVSDELFGYKYTDFAPSAPEFQKEAKKRVDELHMYDVLRADRCISANSLEARVPFGDIAFVRYVMGIDPGMKMNTRSMGKYLLRRAFAEGDWLPQSILYRDKAAFSDAMGHSMVDELKAFAGSQYGDDEAEMNYLRYVHAAPFTKESLLYREIFERHYPGQADMVKGFWMPNPDWPNCRVNDPSARVLVNYGASGV